MEIGVGIGCFVDLFGVWFGFDLFCDVLMFVCWCGVLVVNVVGEVVFFVSWYFGVVFMVFMFCFVIDLVVIFWEMWCLFVDGGGFVIGFLFCGILWVDLYVLCVVCG